MIYKTLGSTGEKVSAISVRAWHLSLKHVDEKLSLRALFGSQLIEESISGQLLGLWRRKERTADG